MLQLCYFCLLYGRLCFLDELCSLNIPLLTIKDNSFRKNGGYVNMRDMTTVAGTQKTPVFGPVFIQVSRFFQVCCVSVSWVDSQLQSSENT